MFKTLSTFFGPLVAISTDIRITPEVNEVGHWEFSDLLNILKVYEKFYSNRSGTMLDIGCNVGSWLLPLAQRYSQNKILAIDCQQLALDCVDQTIKLNNLNNVQTMCYAVSNVCNTTTYKRINYHWGANFGAYEFEEPYSSSDFNGQTLQETDNINIVTIDSLSVGDVVFIKLDIEGMEYSSLCGAVNTIQNCQPFIAYEFHKTNHAALLNLLTKLNYLIYDTIGQMNIAVPKTITSLIS